MLPQLASFRSRRGGQWLGVGRLFWLVLGYGHVNALSTSHTPLGLLVRGSDSSNGPAQACSILEASYGTQSVLSPGSPTEYDEVASDYFSQTSGDNPACIFSPSTAAQVAHAVQVFTSTNSQFATRCGGHNPNPGFSATDGGVLISLSNLSSITYDNVSKQLSFGSGLHWTDVYKFIEPHGRLVLGGRLGVVGTAGLLLGGGISHFSNKDGLAVKGIVEYEVVLGNGTIVTANASKNCDLFKALKGGGNNLGIVTKFTLSTIPIASPIWGGSIAYDYTELSNFTDAFIAYQQTGGPAQQQQQGASGILPYLIPTNGSIVNTYFYEKPVPYPATLAPFFKVPSLPGGDSTTLQSFTNLTTNIQISEGGIDRWADAALNIAFTASNIKTAFQIITDSAPLVAKFEGGTLTALPQPIFRGVVEQTGTDNVLGLQDVDQCWISMSIGWMNPSDDDAAYATLREIRDKINNATTTAPFLYYNDAGFDQPVIQGYGPQNVQFLKATVQKYDPKGVFTTLMPGGFKVAKV